MKALTLFVIIAILSTGCASMFHGTRDTIYIRSEEPDTRFYLDVREIGKGTSAIAIIPKNGLSDAILRAEKPGCTTKTQQILTEFDAVTLLGILIDYGIISILLIDWAINGAVHRAAQTDYVLTPDCPKKM